VGAEPPAADIFAYIRESKCVILQAWTNRVYICWLVVWNIFPYIGNNHPNWLIFFRGVETTNQHLSSCT
jgi:hypothetical protein